MGQVGSYIQSVCNNTAINCDKSQIRCRLLPAKSGLAESAMVATFSTTDWVRSKVI